MDKLIYYCEGIMEATWLTALVSIPSYLNLFGGRIQNEKNYLLRSLAIVLLTAWIIKLVSQVGCGARAPKSKKSWATSFFRMPLVVPTAIVGLVWITATLMSLSSWNSFWGLPSRRFGSYSYLCCLLFFAAMTTCIRSSQQVNRIVTAVILTSIPISLYGIGQRFSIDPTSLHGGTDLSFRVGSTLANPVFLAGYLIMIVPLSLSRIFVRYLAFRSREANERIPELCQAVVYSAIALLQLWAISLTVSRGPLLGLVGGLSVMSLILALYWRKRVGVQVTIAAGILLLSATAWLCRPGGLFPKFAARPDVQRLYEMVNLQAGTGAERAAAWGVAVQASQFSKNVEDNEGSRDPMAAIRFLVGYGPENVEPACRIYRSTDFNRLLEGVTFFDRLHNDIWDTLITTGLFGLAAYLGLTSLIVYHGCRWLGLVSSPSQRTGFWYLFLSGGVIGSLGLISWQGTGFLGVGLRLGTSLGFMTFLIRTAWRREFDPKAHGAPIESAVTMTALLSGILAHLTEIGFSFSVETTLLYFWSYSALLLVIGHRLPGREQATTPRDEIPKNTEPGSKYLAASSPKSPSKGANRTSMPNPQAGVGVKGSSSPSWGEVTTGALGVAVVLTNLGAVLIVSQLREGGSAIQTFVGAFTRLPGNHDTVNWSLPLLIVSTWLLFAATLTNEARRVWMQKSWLGSWITALFVTGGISLAYCFVLANQMARTPPSSGVTLDNLDRFLQGYTGFVDFHYGFTLVLILAMAACFTVGHPSRRSQPTRFVWVRYGSALGLACAALAVIYSTNMKWAKVGAMMNRAEIFKSRQQWPIVSAICETAIKAVPAADNHYVTLSESLSEHAAGARDPEEQQALFIKADRALEMGGKLRPFYSAYIVRRGDLYLKWAQAEQVADRKISMGRKAIELYKRGTIADPGDNDPWYRMAYTAMTVFRSPDEAHRWLLRSLELCPTSHRTFGLLGNVFFMKAGAEQNSSDREDLFKRAASCYKEAIRLIGTNNVGVGYLYNVALGRSFIELQNRPEAIGAYENALRISPPAERWKTEEALAKLFDESKNRSKAAAHLQRAIEYSPADKRSSLIALQKKLFGTH